MTSASAELMRSRNNKVQRRVFIMNTITAGMVKLFLERWGKVAPNSLRSEVQGMALRVPSHARRIERLAAPQNGVESPRF
jgi:hypothetical protein